MHDQALDNALTRHQSRRHAGHPVVSLVFSPITAILAAEHQPVVWSDACLSNIGALQDKVHAFALSDWWPALHTAALQRLAVRLGCNATELDQRCQEVGCAGLEAMGDHIDIEEGDQLAWTFVVEDAAQVGARLTHQLQQRGLLEMWATLSGLHVPPAVVVDIRQRSWDALAALPSLVALAEAAPRWPVLLACEHDELREDVFQQPDTHTKAMLRAGLVDLPNSTPTNPIRQARVALEALHLPNVAMQLEERTGRSELPPEAALARSQAELALYQLLEARAETRGLFRLNAQMPFFFGPRRAELDLYSEDLQLCVEVDGPHHFLEPSAYRRDRRKDALLQRKGVWVVRVLAEDVVYNQEYVLDQVVENVLERRRRR